MEEWGIKEINTSIELISKVIPNIKHMISPIIDTADAMQNTIGNVNLKRSEIAFQGCWNVFLSVNAMTEHLHTENDCGYTVIKIPLQDCNWKSRENDNPIFLFNINEKTNIVLPLKNVTSFMYS